MNLKINNLNAQFGSFKLKNINIDLRSFKYAVLVGASGAGKSSLIKTLLGFTPVISGEIFFNNTEITYLAPEKRNIGYVPQNICLFPHKTVLENIMFGKQAQFHFDENYFNRLADLLKLKKLLQRDIHNLSGGEKQRTAIMRALMNKPSALILDEPFSSIDEYNKKALWFELKKIITQIKIPVIHITHNLNEAYNLAEYIIIMNNGEIIQADKRETIFERPASEKAARFLNYGNIFNCEVAACHNGLYSLKSQSGISFKIKSKAAFKNNVKICVRPQDIKIVNPNSPLKDEISNNVFSGKIISETFFPDSVFLYFKEENSENEYDFEMNVPSYIYKRYSLCENRKIRIALWEPGMIFLNSE